MSKSLQLHVSTPCHENWQDMAVADKGRFCVSCRKRVIDFTQSSDRKIAEVFKKEGNVCGRFLKSQLERDLVIPKEKNRLWMAASAAVVAFLGLGNSKVFAQTENEKAETVQVEKDKVINSADSTEVTRVITGTVVDEIGLPIPGAVVKNTTSKKELATDFDGNFVIEAEKGNILTITFRELKFKTLVVKDNRKLKITLEATDKPDEATFLGYGTVRTYKSKS
jgi:hypothetical protein